MQPPSILFVALMAQQSKSIQILEFSFAFWGKNDALNLDVYSTHGIPYIP